MLSSLEILRALFEIYDFLEGIGRRYTHTLHTSYTITDTFVYLHIYIQIVLIQQQHQQAGQLQMHKILKN